jgi:hypothetical protein
MAPAMSRWITRRGVGKGHIIGQGHGAIGRETAILGQAALTAKDRDARAGGGAARIWAKRVNDACHLHAKGEGGRWGILIFALDHQEIGKIETAGLNPQPKLALLGGGARYVANGGRGPGPGNVKRAHVIPFSILPNLATNC